MPFSVNINDAFFRAIIAIDDKVLVRKTAKDLALTTCANVAETVEAYELASGTTLAFVDEKNRAARSYTGATLYLKRTPPGAQRCGGIGT